MEYIKLDKFVKLDGGGAFKSKFFTENEGIPLIRIRDVSNGYSKTYYNGEYDEKYIVNTGDYLITMDGEFRINEWTGGRSLLNQRVCRIRVSSSKLSSRYLLHFLPLALKKIEDKTPFVTVKHLSLKDIKEIEIPLPPLEIQIKIASALDKAQELIDNRKAQIEKYDELLQSVFMDMFGDPVTNPKGWEIKKFKEMAKVDTKMIKNFEEYGELPHIGIANIESNTGRLINYKLVKDENLESGKYLFDERHIIFSKIRPNLNKVALPNFKGLSSADSYPILINEKVTNRIFYAYLLRSQLFLDYILKHSVRTNIPKANKKQLEGFDSYCPPLYLQNQFATIVEKVEEEKKVLGESLTQMEENFNSIMQRAFRGELF